MKTTHCLAYTKPVALALLLAGGALISTAGLSAQESATPGLLGERYIGATIDWVSFDDDDVDDGVGVSVAYNHPLNDEVDLSLAYSYLETDVFDSVDASLQDLMFGGTYHTEIGRGRGFLRAEVGFLRVKAGGSETELPFVLSAGYERPLGERFAITPFISWSDFIDSDLDVDSTFSFGVVGEWRLRGAVSLLAKLEADDDSDIGLSAGAAFRF